MSDNKWLNNRETLTRQPEHFGEVWLSSAEPSFIIYSYRAKLR